MTFIAFAGDWHGNPFWATEMITSAARRGVTTIIHTGDYGYKFAVGYVVAVEDALDRHGMRLMFVDGNHDEHPFLAGLERDESGLAILSERQRHIPRGHRFTLGANTFLGLGGAVSVDRWGQPEIWWPTEVISEDDAQRAMAGGRVDVMVTHDCPDGVMIPGLDGPSPWSADALRRADAHRGVLRQVVDAVQPRLLVHGHYHRAYEADLNGTHIIGLDCDGSSWTKNIRTMDVDEELLP